MEQLQHEQQLEKEESQPVQRSLGFVADVKLSCTVEFGCTQMTVEELLQLQPGAVISLDRLAGEPLEIRANGKLIAKGEAVVVNDHFGIRITEIADGDG